MRSKIINPQRYHGDPRGLYAKLADELLLHLFRMNERMIGEPVLDSQRKTIEGGVLFIALRRVHVVHGKHNLFSQQLVVVGEQCSVEMQELVVPQDVKDLWLRCGGVADQLGVVAQNPCGFLQQAHMRILIAPQF